MKYFINFSLLRRNRNFCFLYLGQFVSFLGTMITGVALPYQIYHLTHSTLMVGLLSLTQLLPLLVTALIGGVFADRYHRRQLLLISECCLALGCLTLAFNAALPQPHIMLIFVTAFLMSALTGLHRPALDSIVQQIVKKEDFAQVGALSSFKWSVGAIAGPAIGGLVIATLGLVTTYFFDLLTFIFSLVMLLSMTHIPKPISKMDESTFAALKIGFRYAFSKQELVGTYFIDFVAMIFGMPQALFPAIANSLGGATTLGMLYSAPAVGTLFISFLSGWTAVIKRQGLAISISAALWGVAIILFGMTYKINLFMGLFFLALAGAFDSLSGIFRSIMWNHIIPNHLRGRLSGIEMISYLSGPKLGDTEAGLVAAAFGITTSIISGGVLCVLSVVILSYYLPKFLQYREEESLGSEAVM